MAAALHEVYQALGDPTRLTLIERLGDQGEMTTLELIDGLGMSRQAASKHLLVLENVGLVTSRNVGRTVLRKLKSEGLVQAEDWLAARALLWEKRLQALADYVEGS